MSATDAGAQWSMARTSSRSSRTLFALLAAAHLLKAFWSLEQGLVVALIQNLAVCAALALFAAGFHLAPRRSLPYRLVGFTVIVAVLAVAVDILTAIAPDG